MTTAAKAKSGESAGSTLLDLFKTIVYALLLALVIRFVLVQPFRIPSGSMQPTLLVGDYVVVTKWSYGYSRYSFSPIPGLPEGRIFGQTPQRGDIAVFRPVGQEDKDFIKRVVGLPGDRIRLIGGVVHINGEPAKRESLGVRPFSDREGITDIQAYRETLPGGQAHTIFERGSEAEGTCIDSRGQSRCAVDDWPVGGGEHVVPEGHYFMMGDDRDNSDDSRGSVGDVPFDHFVGKAQFVFISYDDSANLFLPWTWITGIRGDRLVRAVD
jgi:signal peptidase I